MGLSEEEFWELAPQEFYALAKRYEAREEAEYLRAGIVAATIANVFRDKKSKPFTPQDFMPVKRGRTQKQSWQQQLEIVKMLNVAFEGKDERGKKE